MKSLSVETGVTCPFLPHCRIRLIDSGSPLFRSTISGIVSRVSRNTTGTHGRSPPRVSLIDHLSYRVDLLTRPPRVLNILDRTYRVGSPGWWSGWGSETGRSDYEWCPVKPFLVPKRVWVLKFTTSPAEVSSWVQGWIRPSIWSWYVEIVRIVDQNKQVSPLR